MGVPSDPGSANWHQNDDPRPQKWSPQASKMPARWSSQPPSQPAEQQPQVRQSAVGGPAAGGVSPLDTPRQALACRRRREHTSAKGPNLSRRALWALRPVPPALRRPSPLRSQIVLFRTWSEEPQKCRKIASQGVPNGAPNHKNLQNIHSGRPLKSKLGKTPQIVRILTPSNPLKRVKTNTKTQFSRFHPDTKKSQK